MKVKVMDEYGLVQHLVGEREKKQRALVPASLGEQVGNASSQWQGRRKVDNQLLSERFCENSDSLQHIASF